MKNFIQKGDTITLTAPTGGVISGTGVVVGSIFGIAAGDVAANADVEVQTCGVFELPKATGAIAQGAKVYWNAANANVTTTVTGNTLIGAATVAALSGAATVRVRLNGTV